MKKMKKFVLYSDKVHFCKEYEKGEQGQLVKLEKPIYGFSVGVWRHSFACTLTEALKQWKCVKQILKFKRFYFSISPLETGTQFPILSFPIVYLYSLIDRKEFLKTKLL